MGASHQNIPPPPPQPPLPHHHHRSSQVCPALLACSLARPVGSVDSCCCCYCYCYCYCYCCCSHSHSAPNPPSPAANAAQNHPTIPYLLKTRAFCMCTQAQESRCTISTNQFSPPPHLRKADSNLLYSFLSAGPVPNCSSTRSSPSLLARPTSPSLSSSSSPLPSRATQSVIWFLLSHLPFHLAQASSNYT